MLLLRCTVSWKSCLLNISLEWDIYGQGFLKVSGCFQVILRTRRMRGTEGLRLAMASSFLGIGRWANSLTQQHYVSACRFFFSSLFFFSSPLWLHRVASDTDNLSWDKEMISYSQREIKLGLLGTDSATFFHRHQKSVSGWGAKMIYHLKKSWWWNIAVHEAEEKEAICTWSSSNMSSFSLVKNQFLVPSCFLLICLC